MHRWTYVIEEVSAGCYRVEAIRDTHNSIQRDGFEDVIARVLKDSFEMEMSFGTIPGDALFYVTKGYKKVWDSTYYKEAYGSWLINDIRTKSRIEYDAKEFWIVMCHDQAKGPPAYWSGRLPGLVQDSIEYFQKLMYFY